MCAGDSSDNGFTICLHFVLCLKWGFVWSWLSDCSCFLLRQTTFQQFLLILDLSTQLCEHSVFIIYRDDGQNYRNKSRVVIKQNYSLTAVCLYCHWADRQLHVDPPASPLDCGYNANDFGICVKLPDCCRPGGTWNAHRREHMETVVCGGGTEMCSPGVWPLTHSSTTTLIHSPPPCPRMPFFKCVSSWMAVGGLCRREWGYQVSFKKSRCRDWLNMEHDFIQTKL